MGHLPNGQRRERHDSQPREEIMFKLSKTIMVSGLFACTLANVLMAAQVNDPVPTVMHDEVIAKLLAEGYHEIRVTEADECRLVAFDKNGSEVILTVDLETRKVLDEVCVHMGDE